ncbi:MAG: hypothetical protein FIA92_17090 [Chloroflexi bacterium]|nr:hypothetical protein [Chloroflexota bacterium]
MSRGEAWASAALVFGLALAMGAWASSIIVFPRPEDVAYYVGVGRNLVEGRGLTTDAIWSFQTPPLAFPRPAFEVWLPLPTLLAAVPMALLGPTFSAAQLMSVVSFAILAVLGWRLAADVAIERSLPPNRARTLVLGTGLTIAAYLPLVLPAALPDSTLLFGVLVLGAVVVMNRISREYRHGGKIRRSPLVLLGLLLGLAALTRTEAILLALTWAILAWRLAPNLGGWFRLIALPAAVSILVFAPWAIRDWLEFGTPFPGQALLNALSLDGRDIFAWHDQPTLGRYLDAGLPRLLELRWIGFLHNLVTVLLFLGVPLSVIGLIGLLDLTRTPALRPLLLFSILVFAVASLVFPVSTTWGTFQHAAGAIHVLLIISALLAFDRLFARVSARRGWSKPVAWLGAAFAISASLLFTAVVLPSEGATGRSTAARYAALPAALAAAGAPLEDEPGPVITDFPIWFAEETRHRAIALPNEPPASILDLARSFDPPARLLVVEASNTGVWPAAILSGGPDAACFVPLELPASAGSHPLDDVLAFRIRCP